MIKRGEYNQTVRLMHEVGNKGEKQVLILGFLFFKHFISSCFHILQDFNAHPLQCGYSHITCFTQKVSDFAKG